MKLIAVLTVSLAVLGASTANEEKKKRVVAFYKCLSCNKDQAAREEFMKCKELKPEKSNLLAEECQVKHMPEATTPEERWETVCKNEDGVAEKLYDCIMDPEKKKELSDEDKTQLKEFVNCAMKVNMKFCGQ